jgi:hypothetical protein
MIRTENDLKIQRSNGAIETVLTLEMLKQHLEIRVGHAFDMKLSKTINLYFKDELITSVTL